MVTDSLTWGKLIPSLATGAVLGVLVGNPSPLLLALFILFFVDLLTGVWSGVKQGKFESRIMRKSVTKFILYCVSIIVAHQFAVIPMLFWVEDAIIGFLSLVELSSIGENMSKLGFTFPSYEQLKQFVVRSNKNNESPNEPKTLKRKTSEPIADDDAENYGA